MFQVIDNFVSNRYATDLENMCKQEVPWYLEGDMSGVNRKNPDNKKYNAPGADYEGPQYGFGHWALHPNGERSSFFERVYPLVYSLEEKAQISIERIARIRLALTTSVGKEVQHLPHVDYFLPHKVLLYYVNDSDGDTFMFNEMYSPENHNSLSNFTLKQRVTPKKNRAIIFDGLTYHNSSKPVKNTARYVINIDFN
jgi:hypothetical protein